MLIKEGLIQVYTGSGKGKTTSSFGLTMRAIGRNWNVLIVQFLKGDNASEESYGEISTCRKFKNQLTVVQSGRKKIVLEHNKDDEDKKLAKETWDKMLTILKEGKRKDGGIYEPYNMLVMDEILPTVNLGLITQKQFFEFIAKVKESNPKIELVLTGRLWSETLYDKIKDVCDLMTDCRCVKHYFNKHCSVCKRSFEYRSNYCPNCGGELSTVNARLGVEY